MKQNNWKLSASWLNAFKACPMRCYLKYVLGLRPIESTDSQRIGTNWHRLLEIIGMKPKGLCPDCLPGNVKEDCPLCQETGVLPENLMDAATREINQQYAVIPGYKTQEEWDLERIILLYSLSAYNWYYANATHKVIVNEHQFEMPLTNPKTNRALPDVNVVGKIDKILESEKGIYFIEEHKTTSKSVDSDSTYWKNLGLSAQANLYPLALRKLVLDNGFNFGAWTGGILYDVWHKPTIRPKKLTQADSKKFIETGEYCGQKFKIAIETDKDHIVEVAVNDKPTEIEPGKKEGTFAIRETAEMFGARLLQDVSERPEFYFARREFAVLDSQLEQFQKELYGIYKTARYMDKNNCWYRNSSQCEATFKCPYLEICYNNIKIDEKNLPNGFYLRGVKNASN